MLAAGATQGDIAERLFISPHTVRTHVRNLLRKIGARSRVEAVTLALGEGLIDVGSPMDSCCVSLLVLDTALRVRIAAALEHDQIHVMTLNGVVDAGSPDWPPDTDVVIVGVGDIGLTRDAYLDAYTGESLVGAGATLIVVDGDPDVVNLRAALVAGARGYVAQLHAPSDVVNAVHCVQLGGLWIDEQVCDALIGALASGTGNDLRLSAG
jgi:DNA-binding NarL/FixJ family response regulator